MIFKIMKGISEALLPMVIYTICQELSLEEYRKYSTFEEACYCALLPIPQPSLWYADHISFLGNGKKPEPLREGGAFGGST